ncbi:hypothetical protein CMI37_08780 [Candidatus Pacearchaeota archaeon]|nr:hypothetical protein [Candidatus Pacearchaeota archaeon]|tara:strand:+ start:7676 stop:7891 length:216 start_codon:yes stop_codon:yes gene_type:complete
MNSITLVIIPGSGARNLNVAAGYTVQSLITDNNLHGRDIIINGVGVQPANYSETLIPENAEVFATGSVKGN